MAGHELIARYRGARRCSRKVVLEGFHALKHALRFGAAVEHAVSPDPERIEELAADLAPDLQPRIRPLLSVVPARLFRELAPHPPPTPLLAIARRPETSLAHFAAAGAAPAVLLDRPRHLGNLGATVRVAAAAEARGVLVFGGEDPWHPTAVRTAAGLHFALPVLRLRSLEELPGPILALDPEGARLDPARIPRGAVLAFGSERRGLSPEIRARAVERLALPMRPGVSSLNLATAVAAVLYALSFHADPGCR